MVEAASKPEDRRFITETQYVALVRALSLIPVSGPLHIRAMQTAFEILDGLNKQEIAPDGKAIEDA